MIKPIKYYATVSVTQYDNYKNTVNTLFSGKSFQVMEITYNYDKSEKYVEGITGKDEWVKIPLDIFIHAFSEEEPPLSRTEI